MKVEIENIRKQGGSCNFCSRGEIPEWGGSLVYPYDKVYTITKEKGSGIKASICEDCLHELFEKTALTKQP